MLYPSRLLISALLLICSQCPAMATANPSITLATYDYPPYCDSNDRDGGALVALVKAAFAEEDISVNLIVLPWQRVSSLTASGRFDGVIGVWKTDAANMKVDPGPPVFYSWLGFYQRQPGKLPQADLLAKRQIGVVSGYHYPAAIRQLGGSLDAARNDETNLRKLQQGRIDIAITEKAVGDALISQRRIPARPALYWGGWILEKEPLSVGFYRGGLQALWQKAFERGLRKLQHNGKYHAIAARYGLNDYTVPQKQ